MICPHMADYDFENPTFDPDGPGIDDDYSLDLPDAIMDPLPPRVQKELNTSGDNIQSLRVRLERQNLRPRRMGCAPTVSTMTSSGSMPTAKRSTGRLATKIS